MQEELITSTESLRLFHQSNDRSSGVDSSSNFTKLSQPPTMILKSKISPSPKLQPQVVPLFNSQSMYQKMQDSEKQISLKNVTFLESTITNIPSEAGNNLRAVVEIGSTKFRLGQ